MLSVARNIDSPFPVAPRGNLNSDFYLDMYNRSSMIMEPMITSFWRERMENLNQFCRKLDEIEFVSRATFHKPTIMWYLPNDKWSIIEKGDRFFTIQDEKGEKLKEI